MSCVWFGQLEIPGFYVVNLNHSWKSLLLDEHLQMHRGRFLSNLQQNTIGFLNLLTFSKAPVLQIRTYYSLFNNNRCLQKAVATRRNIFCDCDKHCVRIKMAAYSINGCLKTHGYNTLKTDVRCYCVMSNWGVLIHERMVDNTSVLVKWQSLETSVRSAEPLNTLKLQFCQG
jgi:hypothetical protein